jgi:RNA recognition motif-containing protein
MSQKLYVGNLPYQVDETELTQLFARCGSVESVTVMRDRATGRARGFGFVEMSSDEDAQKAIDSFNGSELGGRTLTVNDARPKAAHGGGFGGDAGGGHSRRRSEPRW